MNTVKNLPSTSLILKKCNKAKSRVRSLISESGIQVNDPTEIMSKVRDFIRNYTLEEARKLRRNVWITQVDSKY